MRGIMNLSFRGAALAALLFASCVSGSHSTDPGNSNPGWGWRSAGLTASSVDLDSTAGYINITHVGNRLYVMDSRTLAGVRKYRMYTSLQGTTVWDSLSLPNGLSPYSWLPDSPYLYVGTEETGDVWKYDSRTSGWTDMNTGADSGFAVQGLGMYEGGLVACLASPNKYTRPILWNQAGNWVNLNKSGQFPISRSFHSGLEYNGTFYAATYDTGVWTWSPSDSVWQKLADPVAQYESTVLTGKFPRALSVFHDSLYIGYFNLMGIQKIANGNTWVRADSCLAYMLADGVNSNTNCNSAVNVYALSTWNNHLISAGYYSSVPMVYMAPTQAKAWAALGADTWKGGTTTYDMTVVGDTLYTASWEAVWKYPLSQLDSSVKTYPAYPQYPSSSSTATAAKAMSSAALAKKK